MLAPPERGEPSRKVIPACRQAAARLASTPGTREDRAPQLSIQEGIRSTNRLRLLQGRELEASTAPAAAAVGNPRRVTRPSNRQI